MADHDGASHAAADDQLAAIQSLARELDEADIDYWLFGGWAVDFWVGEMTRPHDDIDAAAWRTDFDAIKSALTDAGWQHTPTPEDLVGTRYQYETSTVEFTFIESGRAGEVVVPLPSGPVIWSLQPFGSGRRRLGDVDCRVIPLDVLIAGKSQPRQGSSEGAKDRADLDALSRITD